MKGSCQVRVKETHTVCSETWLRGPDARSHALVESLRFVSFYKLLIFVEIYFVCAGGYVHVSLRVCVHVYAHRGQRT